MADAKIRLSVDGSSQVISEFDKVESKMGKLEAIAARAKSSLALMGVGLGVNEIARLSDEYTKYTAQLKLATASETEFANAKQTVSKIARESQSDLAATGVLYARITNGTRELGLSQQKVGAITEAVTLSLKASGATQEESASATLQLSQAFASGTLRGEEFNAVNEAAPRLMRALADGLGVPVGALKNMATEGKITSEVMANTLPKALEDLRKEAAQVQTISGAYTNLKNNVMEFIGAQAQQNGTAAILSTTINTLANNLNYISAAAAGFTTIKVSQKFAEIATSMVSNIAASNELTATKVRETAATVAVAQSNVRETESKLLQLTQTQAAIVGAREEAIAKLNVANATIAKSQAQIQAATSAGALSSALRLVQQGELSLTGAMQARSAATAELAVLGRQQVALSTQATAATIAQAEAQAGLATVTAGASMGAGLLSRTVGFLGGPIGAVTTLLGLGVTAWLAWGSASKDAGEKAQGSVEKSTEEIMADLDAQIRKLKERNALASSGLVDIAKNESESSKKMSRLRAQMSDAEAGQGEYANMNQSGRMAILQKLSEQYGALYAQIQVATEEQRKFDATGKVATDLIEVRERLLGVDRQYLDDLNKLDKAREKGAIDEKEFIHLTSMLANQTYEKSKAGKEAAKSLEEEGLSYKSLKKTIGEKIAVVDLDIETERKLTDGQKIAAKFCQDLLNVKNNLTVKQKQEIANSLELLIAREKVNEQAKRDEEFAKRAVEENVHFAESIQDVTQNLYAQVAAQSELNNKIGLSKEALVKLESAQLNEDATKKESIATTMDMVDWTGKLGDEYREQSKQLRELAKLKQTGFAKEADYEQMQSQIKAIAEESKRFSEDINRGLTDALYRGFESGKGFAKSFWDSLKNTAKTMLLKIAVQGVMTGVLGMGAMGTANASPLASMSNIAGGGMNSFSSLANMATAGKSLWDGFATAGTLGNGFWGSLAGGLNGAGAGSGLTSSLGLDVGNYLQSALGNNVAGSLSSGISSISAAMPYAAAAIAAFQISKSINGGYRIGGLSADAGAMLGIAPRLFGMQDKQMGGQTITGALGTQDLMRNQAWSQSGGLFRSDRAGTWSYGLKDSTAVQDGKSYVDSASLSSDKALLAGLNTGYAAVKAASTEFAKALGLNADAIAQRTDALNLTLGKTQEETNAAIQKTFSGIADSIATSLVPDIAGLSVQGESSAQTMARLAVSLKSVNDILGMIGVEKFASTLDGAKAAQHMAELNGGLEKFTANARTYAQDVATDADRLATSVVRVNDQMQSLGLSNVRTQDQFAKLVKSLDLSTEAGAHTFNVLMEIAPAFSQVAQAASAAMNEVTSKSTELLQAKATVRSTLQSIATSVHELASAADTAAENLKTSRANISQAYFEAQNAVAQAQERIADLSRESANRLREFGSNIDDFLQSLKTTELGSATPASSNRALREQLGDVGAKAMNDDKDAQQKVISIASAFLKSAKDVNATAIGFARDEAYVKTLLQNISAKANTSLKEIQSNQAPAADPMLQANQALTLATENLARVTVVAQMSGANMARDITGAGQQYVDLMRNYGVAQAEVARTQADYRAAIELTKNMQLSSTASMSNLMKGLVDLTAANAGVVSSQVALDKAVADGAKQLGLSAGSAAELAAKLGLTGQAAIDFANKIGVSGLGTALSSSELAASAFASRLGLTGQAALDFVRAMDANNISGSLTASDVAAMLLARQLGMSAGTAAELAAKLGLTGQAAIDFTNKIGAPDLGLALSSSSLAASTLATRLGLTGQAAIDFVKAADANKFASSLSAGDVAASNFGTALNSSTTSIEQFAKSLNGLGLDHFDFEALIKTTSGGAIDALVRLINGAIKVERPSQPAQSVNEQLVRDWYATTPGAIKTPDLEGMAYWIDSIVKHGVTETKRAFDYAVMTYQPPAAPAPVSAASSSEQTVEQLAATIRELSATIEKLKASSDKVERNTADAADALMRVTRGGTTMKVEKI